MSDNVFKALLIAGVLAILVLQIVSVMYMRKKFDDNIIILQSSENTMARGIVSIESIVNKMQDAAAADKKTSQSGAH